MLATWGQQLIRTDDQEFGLLSEEPTILGMEPVPCSLSAPGKA